MGIFNSFEAYRACEANRYSRYVILAAGAVAPGEIATTQFAWRGSTLRELVERADAQLDTPAGLITAVHKCLRARHEYEGVSPEGKQFNRNEVVQSIVLQASGSRRYAIANDARRQPQLELNDDNTGTATVARWPKAAAPPTVMAAPYDPATPPRHIYQARTASSDIDFWVAAQDTALKIPDIEQIERIETALYDRIKA